MAPAVAARRLLQSDSSQTDRSDNRTMNQTDKSDNRTIGPNLIEPQVIELIAQPYSRAITKTRKQMAPAVAARRLLQSESSETDRSDNRTMNQTGKSDNRTIGPKLIEPIRAILIGPITEI